MSIFTEADIAQFAPDVEYTGVKLSSLIMQVENYIAGKLRRITLADFEYKQRLDIAHTTSEFYINIRPVVNMIQLRIRYQQLANFGRTIRPDWQVLTPEQYELDPFDGLVELLDSRALNTGKTLIEVKYISGFSNLESDDAENPNLVIPDADINAIKLAIGKGLETLESGIIDALRSESLAGETTIEYQDIARFTNGDSALDYIMKPFLMPLIMKYQAI